MMPEFTAPKNYKDQAKILEYIEAERKEWLEKAALSPVTGRVLAIGVKTSSGSEIFCDDEKTALVAFWAKVVEFGRARVQLAGFNCYRFDLPFLVRRSWLHGVAVPDGVQDARGYFNRIHFADLYEAWQCGDKGASISLDSLAKYLGVGAKTGEGAHFAALWATERKLALAYLENDLALTEGVARRLGVWVDGEKAPAKNPTVETLMAAPATPDAEEDY